MESERVMVNKQKKWVGFIAVEFYSEDCDSEMESYLKAKDKIEDMNEAIYDTYHGDSNVLWLDEVASK